jgi:hypothetical protein
MPSIGSQSEVELTSKPCQVDGASLCKMTLHVLVPNKLPFNQSSVKDCHTEEVRQSFVFNIKPKHDFRDADDRY